MSAQRRSATKRRSSGKRSGRAVQPVPSERQTSTTAPSTQTSTAAMSAVSPKNASGKEASAKAAVTTRSASDGSTARKDAPGARRKPKVDAERPKGRTLVNTDRFDGVRRFSRETWAEIKKVNWPDRETTRNLTLVVVAVSAILGIMLGGIDFVLFQLFEALP